MTDRRAEIVELSAAVGHGNWAAEEEFTGEVFLTDADGCPSPVFIRAKTQYDALRAGDGDDRCRDSGHRIAVDVA